MSANKSSSEKARQFRAVIFLDQNDKWWWQHMITKDMEGPFDTLPQAVEDMYGE